MKVNSIFIKEWQYATEGLLDMTFEEFEWDYDEGVDAFERWTALARRIAGLVEDIPDDMLNDALEWAESVDDTDWARHDKKWIQSYRDLSIAAGRYREFTEADAAIVIHTCGRSGMRSHKAKPDFRHRGKAWVLNDGFLDD
jgi:hypothetical protein